ncbi:MAG: hypothetical protein ACT6FB_01220 [Methanosarcinaceae archaeon]
MMDISDGLAMSLHDVADAGAGSDLRFNDNAPLIDDDAHVFADSADEAAELAFNIGGDNGLLFSGRLDMLEVMHILLQRCTG